MTVLFLFASQSEYENEFLSQGLTRTQTKLNVNKGKKCLKLNNKK